MTQNNQKAQVILNWLKDPTTKRYVKSLLEDEKALSILAMQSMQQAISNGLTQRSEDEIKVFSDLKATKILLSNIPHQILTKHEDGEDLSEEDLKELESFFEQLPN